MVYAILYVGAFSCLCACTLQDGSTPGEGSVISDVGTDGWVRVRWDTGSVNSYRMGKEDKYDLSLAPSELSPKTKTEEVKEEMKDIQLTEGNCTFEDHVTFIVLTCVHASVGIWLPWQSVVVLLYPDPFLGPAMISPLWVRLF